MGENVKENFSEPEEKFAVLPKGKKYLVEVGEDGKIKGYFSLQPKGLGKGWIALYQAAISKIADMHLTGEQYRVFLKLLCKLDFENYICVSQKELSKELGIRQSHISEAIKVLCEKTIIVEGPRAGLIKTYQLNPYVACKGKNRKEFILDFEENLEKQGKNILDASKYF